MCAAAQRSETSSNRFATRAIVATRKHASEPRKPSKPPSGPAAAADLGVGRRRYQPVGGLQLHGLASEAVATASGYAGVTTWLVDQIRRHSREVASTFALSTEVTEPRRPRASSNARRRIRAISCSA